MSILIAFVSVALLTGAAIGAGAAVLHGLNLMGRFDRLSAVGWSFAIGIGGLGWVIFFLAVASWIGREIFIATLLIASCGLTFLRSSPPSRADRGPDRWIFWLLIFVLAGIATVDFAEAISPPTDADSLAYHFALPKLFLEQGRLVFVPRAADGAVPLLLQMTYLAALAVGGEMAMTMWVGVVSWMAGFMLFVIARQYLSCQWALVVALLFLSTPMVLYTGGSGQIEPKLTLFVMISAVAVMYAIQTRDAAFVILAGLGVGFFVGSKYTGVIFAVAAAIPFLAFWRSPRILMLYGTAALIAGGQWYAWNWWHTADPVFPLLGQILGFPHPELWSGTQDTIFRQMQAAVELPLPRMPWWFVFYPFHATLDPVDVLEAGRTGFGPFGLLALPFFIAGVYRWRTRIVAHPLFVIALAMLAFYVLWFGSGVSQRLRHLLPVWPLFLLCVTVVSIRWVEGSSLKRPLIAAVIATLGVQLAGQMLFGVSYVRHLLQGETREAFLERSVTNFGFVSPAEAKMKPDDRILINERQLVYLFDRPVFYYHDFDQNQIVARNSASEPARLLRELNAQKITMLLVPVSTETRTEAGDLALGVQALVAQGCAESLGVATARSFGSRTLDAASAGMASAVIYRLTPLHCRL